MKKRTLSLKLLSIVVLSICVMGLFLYAKIAPFSIAYNQREAVTEVTLKKYINYNEEWGNGTLLQLGVKTGIKYTNEQSQSPIKDTTVTISAPQINGVYPEKVAVVAKSTKATNGKVTNAEAEVAYNQNTGTVTIQASNIDENGNPIYSEINQNARDEYEVVFNYGNEAYDAEGQEKELLVKTSVTENLFADEDNIAQSDNEYKENVSANIGTILSTEQTTNGLYNGYIKSNIINGTDIATTFTQNEEIQIGKKEAENRINWTESATFVRDNQDLGNGANLVYKSTKIRKTDIQKVLGENGSLEVLDINGNVIATINKDTQYDENGTYTIVYENEPEQITLVTSDIVNEGILQLENVKEIKPTMLSANNIQIKTTSSIANEQTSENIADIKESETKINLNLNNENWTNEIQNELTFDLTLKSNNSKYNLFKNPTIRIELPEEVEKIVLGESYLVYGNGIELQNVVVDGNAIIATMAGAQTQYNENDLGLETNLKINATVILAKDIETKQQNINVVYTNGYTIDNSIETENFNKEIKVNNFKQEETKPEENNGIFSQIGIQQVSLNKANSIIPQANNDLKIEVVPIKGETAIANGDVAYEGEYLKYNIRLTNSSDKDMKNVAIVATIPEGLTYGELQTEDYKIYGKYEYNFETETREKQINIGTIKAKESTTLFYEVKVDDLAENENQKEITTKIASYVGEEQGETYEANLIVKPAEVKAYISSTRLSTENNFGYDIYLDSKIEGDVTAKLHFPEEFNLITVTKIENNAENGVGDVVFDTDEDKTDRNTLNVEISSNNMVTTKLEANNCHYLFSGNMNTQKIESGKYEEKTSYAEAVGNNATYTSNENRVKLAKAYLDVIMNSDNEGEEVNYGDEINYEIKITNIDVIEDDKTSYREISLTDFLPESVKASEIVYNNWTLEQNGEDETATNLVKQENIVEEISGATTDEDGNREPNINLSLLIPQGETATLNVKTTAGSVVKDTKIENFATASSYGIDTKLTNTISHTILAEQEDNEEEEDLIEYDDKNQNNSNGNTNNTQNNQNNNNQANNGEENNYSISGKAWLDENTNAQRESSEKSLSGIEVMLIDLNNSSAIKDKKSTDNNGKYEFSGLTSGDYIVVFNYDTAKYRITEYKLAGISDTVNSDAISQTITLNGEQKKVGLTDTIKLSNSVSNIDIGLIENKKFDFKIDKYISKVTVSTSNGTKVTEYNNSKLAKTEIRAKEIEGATVVIEYKIVVTNVGELAGKVNQIVDYVPDGLDFSSELNKNWGNKKPGELINTSITNKTIESGESVELKLILTKNMTSASTGTFVNNVKLDKITNSVGTTDENSDNDASEATAIISVSTGAVLYGTIIAISLLIIALIIYTILKKKQIKPNATHSLPKLSMFLVLVAGILFMQVHQDLAASIGETKYIVTEHAYTNYYTGTKYGSHNWGSTSFYLREDRSIKFLCIDHGAKNSSGWFTKYKEHKVHETSWVDVGRDGDKWSLTDTTEDGQVEMQELDDDYYLFGPYTYKSSFTAAKYKVEVKNVNGESVKATVATKKGEKKTIEDSTKTFYLKIKKTACETRIKSVTITAKQKDEYKKQRTVTYCEHWARPSFAGQEVARQWNETEEKAAKSTEEDEIVWSNEIQYGALEIVKVDKNSKLPLAGVKFRITALTERDITKIATGVETFEGTTDENGRVSFDNLPGGYWWKVDEIKNPIYGYTPLDHIDGEPIKTWSTAKVAKGKALIYDNTSEDEDAVRKTFKNKLHIVELSTVTKVDRDTLKPIGKVKGYLRTIKSGKTVYIHATKKGSKYVVSSDADYVKDKKDATIFETEEGTGKFQIEGLLEGNYTVVEIENPDGHYQDIPTNGLEFPIEVSNSNSENMVYNTKVYIDLSGKVWLDKYSSKTSYRNDLYKTNEHTTQDGYVDDSDILLDGISVKLVDSNGNVVKNKDGKECIATTSNGGAYKFEYVAMYDPDDETKLLDQLKLDTYHVEFEYDGLTYENVVPTIDKANGSKAAEGDNRTTFNNNFAVIQGPQNSDNRNTGVRISTAGIQANDLEYDYDNSQMASTVKGKAITESVKAGEENVTYSGKYLITARTDYSPANCSFNEMYEKLIQEAKNTTDKTQIPSEIQNINLGLYERAMPDMKLLKDIENVKLAINGYEHVYEYAQKFNHPKDYDDFDVNNGTEQTIGNNKFNVGVQYGEKAGKKPYSRAIYESDYNYVNKNNESKELKVYITYKIALMNGSEILKTQVNSIIDYYDKKYKLVKVGTEVDKGEIKEDKELSNPEITSYNEKYAKITIDTSSLGKIDPNKEKDIYVQFELDRDNVLKVLNLPDKEEILLNNVAEINSYSVFDYNDNVYAGIDVDSNPGNTIPEDITTYEDDTNYAPGLKLVPRADRTISGSVFLDSSTSGEELRTGEERLGDGKYTDGEKGIPGVKVTLTETSGSGIDSITATTDENGNYTISKFIPGEYIITYTWGGQTVDGKTITVQDYKGTIWTEDNKKEKEDNGKNWYKTYMEENDTRYSDAKDNYSTEQEAPKGSRLQIDKELNEQDKYNRTQMDSTTNTMGIGIEEATDGETKYGETKYGETKYGETKYGITSIETGTDGDEFIPLDFNIKNVDFGIVERARQKLDIAKRVKSFKVTLANGQVIVDSTIDENGNLSGETKYITYMGPNINLATNKNGLLKLELDNELIQGAKVQIGYEIVVTNNSELDYDSEEYYLYGTNKIKVVKQKPVGVYDYLDDSMSLDNSTWKIVTREEYDNYEPEKTILEKQLLIERNEKLDQKTILHETAENLEKELAPGNSNKAELYSSKLLANSDEIELNNDTEITKVTRTTATGRKVTPAISTLYDRGETVTVTPPTGDNQNYIIPVTVGVIALIILATGVVIIKRKAV